MAAQNNVYSMGNPVFVNFAFYGALLIMKMFFVHFSVVFYRLTRNVFSTAEDVQMVDPSGKLKTKHDDEFVERSRRAHLNDMENILPFLAIGMLYVATEPAAATALLLFRIFTVARFVQSIAHLGSVRQPARLLGFGAGFAVNIIMGGLTLLAYM